MSTSKKATASKAATASKPQTATAAKPAPPKLFTREQLAETIGKLSKEFTVSHTQTRSRVEHPNVSRLVFGFEQVGNRIKMSCPFFADVPAVRGYHIKVFSRKMDEMHIPVDLAKAVVKDQAL